MTASQQHEKNINVQMKFLLVQKGNTKKKREQITSHIKTYYSSAFDDYLFFMQRANIILQFNIVQSSNTQ